MISPDLHHVTRQSPGALHQRDSRTHKLTAVFALFLQSTNAVSLHSQHQRYASESSRHAILNSLFRCFTFHQIDELQLRGETSTATPTCNLDRCLCFSSTSQNHSHNCRDLHSRNCLCFPCIVSYLFRSSSYLIWFPRYFSFTLFLSPAELSILSNSPNISLYRACFDILLLCASHTSSKEPQYRLINVSAEKGLVARPLQRKVLLFVSCSKSLALIAPRMIANCSRIIGRVAMVTILRLVRIKIS